MFMVNFNLWFHHKWALHDIDGLIPWERDAYLKMVTDYIEAENRRIAAEEAKQKIK